MRQRLAITISSLVAAAILAVGLTAAGFSPVPRPATAEESQDTATTPALDSAATEVGSEDIEPEVVYVKPAPKPKTVVVKRRVTRQASDSAAVKSQRVRATRSRDDDDDERREEHREREREHEHEHEDDD